MSGLTPELGYARAADGTHIAYLVSGRGPVDLLWLRGIYTNVEHEWAEPVLARMLRRLGSVARVITMDRRGTGLSDRVVGRPPGTLEDRADDIGAVLDAVGSRAAVLVGLVSGASLCAVFAATHPERTAGLVVYNPDPTRGWGSGRRPDDDPAYARLIDGVRAGWGTEAFAAAILAESAPSRADDRALAGWLAEDQRLSGGVDDAIAVLRTDHETDVTAILPAVHVPTLVIARGRPDLPPGRRVAAAIPGATLLELPGDDRMALAGDSDAIVDAIEGFLAARRTVPEVDDRILASVLVTDVVGSTALAARIGDRAWADRLERHRARVREALARYRGREVDTAGDGFLATFDGPGRAIRCGLEIASTATVDGLMVRAGIHTGEVEPVGREIRGVAVHIAARVAALAGPAEVFVTSTVRDLVAGSGLTFEDRGRRSLKGLPGRWQVLAAVPPGPTSG